MKVDLLLPIILSPKKTPRKNKSSSLTTEGPNAFPGTQEQKILEIRIWPGVPLTIGLSSNLNQKQIIKFLLTNTQVYE